MNKSRQFTTRNDLDAESREKIDYCCSINSLADTIDLYSQTKQAHWNVKGPQFFALHELFDQLAAPTGGRRRYHRRAGDRLSAARHGAPARQSAAASRVARVPTRRDDRCAAR